MFFFVEVPKSVGSVDGRSFVSIYKGEDHGVVAAYLDDGKFGVDEFPFRGRGSECFFWSCVPAGFQRSPVKLRYWCA